MAAQRLPVRLQRDAEGDDCWIPSPGGVVSALGPLLRSRDALWVGWTGRAGDDADALPVAPSFGDCTLSAVPMSAREVRDHYEGFCNATLWPLFHDAPVAPVVRDDWWQAYVDVNRRFAERIAARAAPRAVVWVHDSQLALVPRMVRERRPDLVIGFFLHIPFPSPDLVGRLPWRREILDGLLGADLVGVHTEADAENVRAATRQHLGSEVRDDQVRHAGRWSSVEAHPISIDATAFDALARSPAVESRAAEIRHALGDPAHLLLGVDRLDYTKGIDARLRAYERLLSQGELDPRSTAFVQIATPTRENVAAYRHHRDDVERIVGCIVARHGDLGVDPLHYLHRECSPEELVAFYVAADVMLVTPYRDGMNLVSKEYVASRTRDDGALVLSERAGAAAELGGAHLVNPYDESSIAAAIVEATREDRQAQRRRMAPMRAHLATHDSRRWAAGFLDSLRAAAVVGEDGRETVPAFEAASAGYIAASA